MNRARPVLVVGGGVAGLTAAEELARNGVPVLLLEKERRVGGHALRWACMATERCQKCSACTAADLKRRVLEEPLVEVLTAGKLESATPEGGAIRVRVVPVPAAADPPEGRQDEEGEGRPVEEALDRDVDAVFVAAGFETFPAALKPMLRYGELDAVLTTADLDRVILEDRLAALPADGSGPAARVAFLQCVGSRDREAGRDYCSQVCCKTSLRLAARLLHARPQWEITIFHIDLQVFGKGFRSFYRALGPKVRLVQGVPSEVLPAEGNRVSLVFEDPATGGNLGAEAFDLVVLAVGMLPPKDACEISGVLGLPLERRGFLQEAEGAAGSRVYAVGACRAPTDIPGARRQAQEAVGRYLVQARG